MMITINNRSKFNSKIIIMAVVMAELLAKFKELLPRSTDNQKDSNRLRDQSHLREKWSHHRQEWSGLHLVSIPNSQKILTQLILIHLVTNNQCRTLNNNNISHHISNNKDLPQVEDCRLHMISLHKDKLTSIKERRLPRLKKTLIHHLLEEHLEEETNRVTSLNKRKKAQEKNSETRTYCVR